MLFKPVKSKCLVVRLRMNASYSHSDTLLMRRLVVQASHKSGQEWSVRQADEQAKIILSTNTC